MGCFIVTGSISDTDADHSRTAGSVNAGTRIFDHRAAFFVQSKELRRFLEDLRVWLGSGDVGSIGYCIKRRY